ncbi:MAG TPA: POTRA domain-containing protein [Thermoanaerobaculia bacterium]|nr:POTRA domain-containing protein [Thermoanaerobaculia bacterium]
MALFALAHALVRLPARAQEAPRPQPSQPGAAATAGAPDTAGVEGKTIGAVHIVTQNIFDPAKPGESRRLFRLANHLHFTTRPEVIRRQLLFHAGDPFSTEAVRESERLLRANPYFYDVAIRPAGSSGDKVDVSVVTRDVWTLQGGASYNHAGGANTGELEIEDVNFLGTGKDLILAHRANVDRRSNLFRYRDPNLFGSRALLDFHLSSNSDGHARLLDLEHPFFALDTRWAAGMTAYQNQQIDRLYFGGEIADRFRQRHDFAELFAGFSPGLVDGATQRWRLGYTYDRSRFAPAAGFPAAAATPADRTLGYPWIGYDYIEDGFVTVRDLDRIQRTEDLNLGRQLSLRLGWSARAFGGDSGQLVFKSKAADAWTPTPRQTLLATASLAGRLRAGLVENGLVGAALRYYARDLGKNLFYFSVSGNAALRLDPETQLLLGGDNGLRGYPLRFQAGDRRFLATLEQRFYGEREYLHLLHLGAAVFFDAGSAWFVEPNPAQPLEANRRILKDIGAGLRICSSRSAGGSVVHFDLAFPLDRTRSLKALQILISTGETF